MAPPAKSGPHPGRALAVLGALIVIMLLGILGGRLIVLALNRLGLAQGLHAPFVATGALVIFGLASFAHASGFLAVYLAGLVVGNRPTRAHNTVVVFLDAVTWLAQIVMFVLLGMLAWPGADWRKRPNWVPLAATRGGCSAASSSGALGRGGGSRLMMFHHAKQRGGLPPSPRVHFA